MSSVASSSSPTLVNPRANIFILVNLGCEMLYVIEQRLQAQKIPDNKSVQVIHDITAVLFEPKFIDSVIVGSTSADAQLLTTDHCKFLLHDIATCSLMRVDQNSWEKLWNLMTMVYKWQTFLSRHHHHLLDITFRHLDGVGQLYAEPRRTMLIDFTKNTLLDFWNSCDEESQAAIYNTNKAWLQCFNTKISLLIRLDFQSLDGTFRANMEQSYFQEFADTIGTNIYVKSMEIATRKRDELAAFMAAKYDNRASQRSTGRLDHLAELLNCQQQQTDSGEDLKPIDAGKFQRQLEESLQQCNVAFEESDVGAKRDEPPQQHEQQHEIDATVGFTSLDECLFPDLPRATAASTDGFVEIETTYRQSADKPENS